MQDNKPIIGVIACSRMMDGEPIQRVIQRYLDGVSRQADAIAMIVPNYQPTEAAAAIVSRLDAILLTGSTTNIEPQRYGSAVPGQAPLDPSRDGFSGALVRAAIAAAKPVFGICRGLQEINVAFGGTLVDMRAEPSRATLHHAPDGAVLAEMFGHSHTVAVQAGTPLAAYAGQTELLVNSVHYQSIDRLGDGLVANALASDGTLEAVSALNTPAPVFAVQWHPEWQAEARPHDLAFWRYFGQVARQHFIADA